MRNTSLVGTPAAWHRRRFAACEGGQSGIELCGLADIASKLAGGFVRLVEHERLHELIRDAISEVPLPTMSNILTLPGTPRALAATFLNVWQAGLDLQLYADRPRVRDLIAVEAYVRQCVGPGAQLLPDLIRAAQAHILHARAVLGEVHAEGFVHISPAWYPLLNSLGEQVNVTIRMPSCVSTQFAWTVSTKIRSELLNDTNVSSKETIVCANPRHEAVEALRWARELIASGQARPHEIAIIAANTDQYDDDLRTMVADSQLPVHFVHGGLAIAEFSGQQAAALADVLGNGLSQDRVVRALRLTYKNIARFNELPPDWYGHVPREAPLLRFDQWDRALTAASSEAGYEKLKETVLPVIGLMEEGTSSAAKIGDTLLTGRAAALWSRALAVGPSEAIDKTIEALRFPDNSEQEASIIYGPSDLLVGSGRKFVRFLGMTSRGWPRTDKEDPLLPDHIVPAAALQPLSRASRDRLSLEFHISEASRIVYSCSRRDPEGRLCAVSPLLPSDITPVSFQRAAVPRHAFSRSDRLLARPEEFAKEALAQSSLNCLRDWTRREVTAHDGWVRSGHPVLAAALFRKHSASSLRSLLTDPLGFVWRYALLWREPPDSEGEEPLTVDHLQMGSLVHSILEAAVSRLEPSPGVARASEAEIASCVSAAAAKVAGEWELKMPLPPLCVWRAVIQKASSDARRVLAFSLPPSPSGSHRTYAEVVFNGDTSTQAKDPWNLGAPVALTGTKLFVTGRIDRLELDGEAWARVVDYKVKNCPKQDPGLDGGRELQRCLYAFAVKQLLPNVQTIESTLLFVDDEMNSFMLADTDAALATLVRCTNAAIEYLEEGTALPGPDHKYDDLIFAYPANAIGTYFDRKSNARNEKLANLMQLWGTG